VSPKVFEKGDAKFVEYIKSKIVTAKEFDETITECTAVDGAGEGKIETYSKELEGVMALRIVGRV
jgi:hypothetical protein